MLISLIDRGNKDEDEEDKNEEERNLWREEIVYFERDHIEIENLERFFIGHIQFMQRDLRRTETFFRENGITGDDLEAKLSALKTIIEERDRFREQIRQLQFTQMTASRMINELYDEKRRFLDQIQELQQQIQELQQENTQLCRDLEYEQTINGRTINNLSNQVNTLENQENIFAAVLNNQDRVVPRLRRQDAFIYEDEYFEASD
ncbi:10510_t:CDS:2 [Gigaspora rosea]|nr:10510_t:CDS:2 [Gigaspora rosea]